MLTKTEFTYHKATLQLVGRFDFHARHDMCKALGNILAHPQVQEITINLAEVSYIDSSAFGQLLIAQEKATGLGKQIVLTGAQGHVKELLDFANFDRYLATTARQVGIRAAGNPAAAAH